MSLENLPLTICVPQSFCFRIKHFPPNRFPNSTQKSLLFNIQDFTIVLTTSSTVGRDVPISVGEVFIRPFYVSKLSRTFVGISFMSIKGFLWIGILFRWRVHFSTCFVILLGSHYIFFKCLIYTFNRFTAKLHEKKNVFVTNLIKLR